MRQGWYQEDDSVNSSCRSNRRLVFLYVRTAKAAGHPIRSCSGRAPSRRRPSSCVRSGWRRLVGKRERLILGRCISLMTFWLRYHECFDVFGLSCHLLCGLVVVSVCCCVGWLSSESAANCLLECICAWKECIQRYWQARAACKGIHTSSQGNIHFIAL